jgi:uncharacterized metal-binding protein YceD (DUF177 family)
MKVHLNQIPFDGKHLEGEEDPQILDLHDAGITPLGPVRYSLDVGLSGGGLFATGQLSTDLQIVCVSCLEDFLLAIRIDDFACQVELTGAEMVDLTPLAREDILLALPPHPRCDWDGRKRCQPALAASDLDRNPSQDPQGSPAQPDVWGALDHLKLD